MKKLNTLQDFITFFESVPSEKWGTDHFHDKDTGCMCANGLLGTRSINKPSEETRRLAKLTGDRKYAERIAGINNGIDGFFLHTSPTILGSNPKERVLNYLYTLEQLQNLAGVE